VIPQHEPGLVSVVICAYNNWPDVEMTIASALNQSYRSLEVIVVDNSSTDATPEAVPKHFGTRVRYIRQPNRDCAGAYNTGFAAARGEFVQFIDGDDALAPNKIEKQVQVFRARPELDFVYGDVRTFQTMAGRAHWSDLETMCGDDMLERLVAPHGIWLDTLGVLSRRVSLKKVGTWDESLYVEDADYWLRAAWAGCRFGYCPTSPVGFKRVRPGQKMQNSPAMEHGLDVVWHKALGYIDREPYRSLLAAKIADHKLRRVIFREQMGKRQALATLAQARATSPATVSARTYAAACITVVLPGGRALARLSWLVPIRRTMASLFNFQAASTRQRNGSSNLANAGPKPL
jgi:glycosyltransferase involved in cell wall biosynthesis